MRVLQVTPSYIPATRYGGPIYSVHGLAKALVQAGHTVDVYTTSVDGPDDSDVPLGTRVDMDGVGVYYFASKFLRRFYYSSAMSSFMSRSIGNYDICHTHSVYLWPTWKASKLAHRAQVARFVSPRGMLVPKLVAAKSKLAKQAWLRTIETRNFQRATGIHFTSELEAVAAQRYLPNSLRKQVVIPNGVEFSNEVKELTTFAQRDLILFLGRINWKKNLDTLISAIEPLQDAELVIAGPAEQDELHRLTHLVNDLGLSHRVRFYGPADSSQKAKLFSQAKALVLCSVNENFGNVVIEALAHGCPVVVNESVGAAVLVKKYDAGLVVDANNLELTAAIARIQSDESSWQRYQINGLRLIQDKFLWKDIALQMSSFYRTLIDQ